MSVFIRLTVAPDNRLVIAGLLALAFTVTACAPSRVPAPVESRKVSKSAPAPTRSASVASDQASVPLPAAPDGFYRVRRGDTLIGISLDHGAAWRDIAAWNQIENPNLIEIDQLLRVRPPNSPSKQIAVAPKTDPKTDLKTDSKTTVQPINPAASKGGAGAPGPSNPGANPATTNAASANPAPNAATAAKPVAAENIALSWPGRGQVITQFSDPGYKGIAISGVEGDPVSAAGDGRVVYSGNGLRGYGNLVIVKHDGDFLTAYAHNKSILVSEGQTVKRGQKIAELGKTDSDIPKLHFEVRRSGKPVDPLKFLAQR
ncbi:MAG: hypothetical protein RIQ29_875 [Pseudomonadota bacterium]